MIAFNGDVVFLDGSGQVRSTNGSLTLRPDDTGTKEVIIGSGSALRPERDIRTDLGTREIRWLKLWAGDAFIPSGNIGAILTNRNSTIISGLLQFDGALITSSNTIWTFLSDNNISFSTAPVLFGKRPSIFAGTPGPAIFSPAATLADLVDARAVSGNIIPDTDIKYQLGDFNKRWAREYASSGIFNELSSPTSGTFILTHGSFVPNADRTLVLGTATQRFSEVRTSSGVLNELSPPTSGTFINLQGSFVPSKDRTLVLGTPTFRFSEVRTSSGVLNEISPPTSGTFLLTHGSIVPNTDRTFVLGTATQRFSEMRASSGILNALSPPTSGTFLNVHGSLIPGRNSLYALGTSSLQWAYIFANSGTIGELTCNDVTIGSVLTTDQTFTNQITISSKMTFEDGVAVTQNGGLNWDMGGGTTTLSNGGTWDWGGVPHINGGACTFQSFAATSTSVISTFIKRPTVNGSGVALAEENYFEVYAGRSVNFGATVANDILEPDTAGGAVANGDDHFITNRSVKLINFSANTQHLNGSQPANWTIRMRLNGSTTDWASGVIQFAPTNSTNLTVLRSWSGNQTIPSGSRCQVSIDNNGGATVNIVFCKAWIGLAVSGVP
jgi:hypothetical protein